MHLRAVSSPPEDLQYAALHGEEITSLSSEPVERAVSSDDNLAIRVQSLSPYGGKFTVDSRSSSCAEGTRIISVDKLSYFPADAPKTIESRVAQPGPAAQRAGQKTHMERRAESAGGGSPRLEIAALPPRLACGSLSSVPAQHANQEPGRPSEALTWNGATVSPKLHSAAEASGAGGKSPAPKASAFPHAQSFPGCRLKSAERVRSPDHGEGPLQAGTRSASQPGATDAPDVCAPPQAAPSQPLSMQTRTGGAGTKIAEESSTAALPVPFPRAQSQPALAPGPAPVAASGALAGLEAGLAHVSLGGGAQAAGGLGPVWQQRRRVSKKKSEREANRVPAGTLQPGQPAAALRRTDATGPWSCQVQRTGGAALRQKAAAAPLAQGAIIEPALETKITDVRVQRLLGKGATASVYCAEWRGSPVACKIVSFPSEGSAASRAPKIRQIIQDFRQELGIMARLKHPNLVRVLGVGTQTPPLFMLTELCEGGTLFDLLHKGREEEPQPSAAEARSEQTPAGRRPAPGAAPTLTDARDDPYRATVAGLMDRLNAQTPGGAFGAQMFPFGDTGGDAQAAEEKKAEGGFWALLGRLSPFAAKKEALPQVKQPSKEPAGAQSEEEILFSRGSKVPLSWKLKTRIALDLAKGCQHLHSLKIIHRDIKSLNVLLSVPVGGVVTDDSKPIAKLADFGCALVTNGVRDNAGGAAGGSLVQGGGWAGTVLWMGPEVLTKRGCNDKSDVYSFAIVLYELLANRIPFQELQGTPYYEKLPVLISAGLRPNMDTHAMPPDVPQGLRDLMTSCWRKDPAHRPQFANIVRALEIILADL
ncbi:hypothetical protein BESB_036180 [Besnoitia besnoiti]|uniref:Protein kinase domain-containing protein n=1 Tax=Besnoitia besnoiti TaxID=94643 RepID=A0A2A9MNB0_BESBE|nr:hypothetical protein BESB_036180 [Besnoitia besnoiti]PFH37160.1 hypothetical protein BESB_036180 [Besnoitia besnoiti]